MKKILLAASLVMIQLASVAAYAEPFNVAKNIPETCQHQGTFEQNLECAQKYFFIAGNPINPFIVQDLVGWISDSGDQIVGIDVLGSQGSNRYFYDKQSVEKTGEYFTVTAKREIDSVRYTVKGITDNGVIVLHEVEWNDEGSGVFHSLLLVRIRESAGLTNAASGQLKLDRKKIVIEKLGFLALGDRVNAEVSVEKNEVIIKTDDENGAKVEKLEISI
jgi:hypothetical protein